MKYNLRATNWEGVGLDRPITLKYLIVSDIIPQLLAWFIKSESTCHHSIKVYLFSGIL